MRRKGSGRGISVGTVVMLTLTAAVLVGFFVVYPKLSGGVQLSARQVGSMLEPWIDLPALATEDIPIQQTESPLQQAEATEAPALLIAAATPQETQVVSTPSPAGTATAPPTAAPTATPQPGGSFTLTAGGTVALEKAVRQAGYYKDIGSYDFTDIFSLISGSFRGDLSWVELENLVVPGATVSALIAPEEVMTMLTAGGIRLAALGFGRVYEQGFDGLNSTRLAADGAGLELFGIHTDELSAAAENQVRTIGGVKVALLHCVDTLTSKSKTALKKDGRTWVVSTTATIEEDIAACRAAGAQCVIVSVHWGTEGKTAPTKAQKTLAQKMADAGADLIIGSGTRRLQTVEYLTAKRETGEAQCLCAYDLGCLISENRTAGALAGILLHVQVNCGADGTVRITQATYTTTYLWRYRQDGSYHYRLLASNATPPDGMSSEETKNMQTALKKVGTVLKDAPLGGRIRKSATETTDNR